MDLIRASLDKNSDHFGLPIKEELFASSILVQRRDIEYESLATIDLPTQIKESPRVNNVLRAQKQVTVTNQDGNQYITTYDEFDAYGRPHLVTESGNPYTSYIDSDIGIPVQPTRVRDVTYFDNYDDWIIGKPEDITVMNNGGGSGNLTIDKEYYSDGLLKSVAQNGSTQLFKYYPNGNLKTKSWKVSGKSYTTTYSDYYRGIARLESKPQSINISRKVNDWGEVTEFTNGRNVPITFERDSLGRVENVEHPDFSGSVTQWNFNENPRLKRVTESNVQTDTEINALGNEISRATTDLISGETTYQTMQYDAYSQLIFQSNVSFLANPTAGIRFQYDVLGRKVYSEDQRNNIVRTCYTQSCLPNGMPYSGWDLSGYITQVETIELPAGGDESGSLGQDVQNITASAAFGDPSDASVLGIFIKENESNGENRYSATLYSRTLSGDPVEIAKGGGTIASRATRTYQYYPNTNLIHYDNSPDLGITELFYDESENIRQKIVDNEITISYRYDHENRILYEDYPNTNGTPDVSYNYDRNGNLKWIDNGYARLSYQYNTADLLEDVTYYIGGTSYYLDYEWNTDRTLAALIYPDLERVEYLPNGYGLPTTVGSYAQGATYHPTKHLKSFEYGNGVSYQAEINDYNVPSSYEVRTGGNALLAQEIYQHNFRKQIYAVDKRLGVGASIVSESYQYTPSNYLKSGMNELGPVNYGYDLLGNITTKQENGQVVTMTYSGAEKGSIGSRITTASSTGTNYNFDYDTLGNVIQNGRNTFVYDNASRLSMVSDLGIRYFYDGRGHRIVEQLPDETKITLRGEKGQVIYQHNVDQKMVYKYYGLGSMLVAESEVACTVNCDVSLDLQPRISDAEHTLDSADAFIIETSAVLVDGQLTYILGVGNDGPDMASNVELLHIIPQGEFDSFTISEGSCEQNERELRCKIGNLSPGEIATFSATVSGLTLEDYKANAVSRVSSFTFDPNSSNNTVVRATSGGSACQSEAAAQGTVVENHLDLIRDYRDDVLANSYLGPQIISAYYDSTPFWLDQMEKNNWSLYVMRINVGVMILISYLGLSPLQLASIILLLALLLCYKSKIFFVGSRKDA